jgi:hypothetical protein
MSKRTALHPRTAVRRLGRRSVLSPFGASPLRDSAGFSPASLPCAISVQHSQCCSEMNGTLNRRHDRAKPCGSSGGPRPAPLAHPEPSSWRGDPDRLDDPTLTRRQCVRTYRRPASACRCATMRADSALPGPIRVKPAPPALTSCAQPIDATLGPSACVRAWTGAVDCAWVLSERLPAVRSSSITSDGVKHPSARRGQRVDGAAGRAQRGREAVLGGVVDDRADPPDPARAGLELAEVGLTIVELRHLWRVSLGGSVSRCTLFRRVGAWQLAQAPLIADALWAHVGERS